MLRVEVISQLSAGDRLVEEWSELAEACPYSTVFQTAEWLVPWWTIIGRRRAGSTLYLITVRDGESLVGLLPLVLSRLRRLSFMGVGVSDYHDAVAQPGHEDEICAAIYSFLREARGWSVLDLRELREGGLLRERKPMPSTGLACSDWPLEACPYLDLPADVPAGERWQKLLGAYSKKTRSNINYYERNLQRAFTVESRVISCESELAGSFERLFELHRRRWSRRWLPGVFTSERLQSFHVEAGRRLLQRGRLRLHALSLDGKIQAALYAFAFHDRTCYYQGGFEPELSRYSLGAVVIASAVRRAAEEGFETFDFLRGNEEYKQRWTRGAHRTNIRRFITVGEGVALKQAEIMHRIANAAETQLKRWFAGGIVRRAPRQAKTDD